MLIPFAVPLGIIFTGAALWPFFEQWATGDRSSHHINDRPRNAPARTGTGVAAICFYGILWAEGANDVLANAFDIPLYTITWIARIAVFVVPIGAYFVTKRICLGLQRHDTSMLTHGVEIGIIKQLPDGEFVEEERPLTEDERAVIDSKKVPLALPAPGEPDANGVPAPGLARRHGLGPRGREPRVHRDRAGARRARQRPRAPRRPRGDRGAASTRPSAPASRASPASTPTRSTKAVAR